MGFSDGSSDLVGFSEGAWDMVLTLLGSDDGTLLGSDDGSALGFGVGSEDGDSEGEYDGTGASVNTVGSCVGLKVGPGVGREVRGGEG